MPLKLREPAALEGFAPQVVRVIFHDSVVRPGGGIRMDIHWQNIGDEPAPRDYWIFVHFRPVGQIDEPYEPGGFSWDFPPARNTSRWHTYFVVKEEGCLFRVPPDIEPGKYVVMVGLYDRDGSKERIGLQNTSRDMGNCRYRVGTVTISRNAPEKSKVLAYRLVWKLREVPPAPISEEPRFISRGRLSLGFDPLRPSISAWRVADQTLPLGGDPAGQGIEAEFVSLDDNIQHSSLAMDAEWSFMCRVTGDRAEYRCRLRYKGCEVARFELKFHVAHMSVDVRMGMVQEGAGFQLLAVTVPSVVSVPQSAPGAAMAIPTYGGQLVDLVQSGRHREVFAANASNPIPGGGVLCESALVSAWSRSLDDRLVAEVLEAGGQRYGTMGIQFTHRLSGAAPEYRECPRKIGELALQIAVPEEGAPTDWIRLASMLSKHVRSQADPFYAGSIIYKIFLDQPTQKHCTTFAEALGLIRRVYNLTDGYPQVVYLVGWQHRGHDSKYPDTTVVNPRLGGADALADLIDEARKLNAVVSFHDNFDDAYMDSPGWDPDIMAIGPSGEIRQGGVWQGNQCYIISPAAYVASGKAQERVDRTAREYPIRDTVHLDVMSSEVVRVDHNPERPAGADQCHAARKQIVEMWRRHGLDVTSEALHASFASWVSHAWHGAKAQEGGPFSQREAVPFVPAVLHSKTTWGGSIDPTYGEPLSMLYGATFSEDWTKETSDQRICERFYYMTLPWSRLAGKAIVKYAREHNTQRVVYTGGDFVEVDLEEHTYRIVAEGTVVSQDYVTTCSVGRRKMMVFARTAQSVVVPFSRAWSRRDTVIAEALHSSGEREVIPHTVRPDGIEISAPASTPVVITKKTAQDES